VPDIRAEIHLRKIDEAGNTEATNPRVLEVEDDERKVRASVPAIELQGRMYISTEEIRRGLIREEYEVGPASGQRWGRSGHHVWK
jgi:hypothetical protein